MSWDQIGIMVFGLSAVALMQMDEPWRRWGPICGVLSQPFWFYTAIQNAQFGVMVMNVFMALTWAYGVYKFWIRRGTAR